jgi:hypothetical protein
MTNAKKININWGQICAGRFFRDGLTSPIEKYPILSGLKSFQIVPPLLKTPIVTQRPNFSKNKKKFEIKLLKMLLGEINISIVKKKMSAPPRTLIMLRNTTKIKITQPKLENKSNNKIKFEYSQT